MIFFLLYIVIIIIPTYIFLMELKILIFGDNSFIAIKEICKISWELGKGERELERKVLKMSFRFWG